MSLSNFSTPRKTLLGAAAVIILGLAYYALSPLWHNVKIDEALPVNEQTPSVPAEGMRNGIDLEHQERQNSVRVVSEPVPIVPTTIHPASGQVRVIRDNGQTYIRYENYKTINGPDVHVYLANDLDAKDYVDLGPIKGTEGNINYSVPDDVDVNQYRYALTWCKQFGVLFNSAELPR